MGFLTVGSQGIRELELHIYIYIYPLTDYIGHLSPAFPTYQQWVSGPLEARHGGGWRPDVRVDHEVLGLEGGARDNWTWTLLLGVWGLGCRV